MGLCESCCFEPELSVIYRNAGITCGADNT